MESSPKRRAQGSVEEAVWAGDASDLRRLASELELLAQYVRERLLADLQHDTPRRHEEFIARYSGYNPTDVESRWAEHEAETRKAIESATITMKARRSRWGMESSGSPDTVISDVDDWRDVTTVAFKLETGSYGRLGGYALEVELGNSSVFKEAGARAHFEAPETHFIDLAGTRIADDFRRQRPSYHWVHKGWFAVLAATAPLAISFILGNILLTLGMSIFLAAPIQLTAGLLGVALAFWARRIVRPFELYADGTSTQAGRKFTIVGSITLWLIGTIAVPILLAAFGLG